MAHYDGTVRNSNRQLIQLCYGEDGMDGSRMEFQQLSTIKPSTAAFERRFYFDRIGHNYQRSVSCGIIHVYGHWGINVWRIHVHVQF